MYKALDQATNQEIIILHPEWNGRIPELRTLATQGRLVCQGCRQRVRVRAGGRRRRHFAHVHLAGCAWGKASWEALEARAVLFDWLLRQFPASKNGQPEVEIEKALPGSDLPRPVDCWVRRASGEPALAYWIIDARMRLEARQAIRQALEKPTVRVNWVLAAKLLEQDAEQNVDHPGSSSRIRLAPTERDFLVSSDYDQIDAELQIYPPQIGQTLHYLDAHTGILTTYRALRLVHAPNIFVGRVERHPFIEIQAHPLSGEFIHPGETESLARSQAALARLEERHRQAVQHLAGWLARGAAPALQRTGARPGTSPARDQAWGVVLPAAAKEYACIFCGELTSEWWTTFVQDGKRLCKCKACLQRGLR